MTNEAAAIEGATPVGVGRYAPSPTGSLHLGNLRTAVAAYASARARGFQFLLRIEDLDLPRCKPEFEAVQISDLQKLGLAWDPLVLRQSQRTDVYAASMQKLKDARLVYPCFCSRREIAEAASAPHGNGSVYPGTCSTIPWAESQRRVAAGEQHCWRIRISQAPTTFFDGFAGQTTIDLAVSTGDFVVQRADGLFAYQFACALDDALSEVTEVLRGDDLLDSGARQAYILSCLRLPVPRYLHIPLMFGSDGKRLAKRIGSEDLTGVLARGYDVPAVVGYLAHSLGQVGVGERIELHELPTRWNQALIPREPVVFSEQILATFRVG